MYGFWRDGGADLLDLDLLELAFARGGLARLGGVRREAPHELLQVRYLVLGLGVGGLDPLTGLHRCQHEIVVIARIDLQLLEVEIRDVRAHLVQEMPVVADDDHGGIVVVERAFQPADRIDVQIVGRFIEQQNVRPGEQRLGEQHPQLQSRGHFAHGTVVPLFRNSGIRQNGAGARLGVVAAIFGECALELGRLHVILIGGLRIGVDPITLLHRGPQFGVPAHDHVEHALVLVPELVLVELAEPHAGLQHDVSRGGLEIAPQHLHEGGFSAAVRPDQPVAVAVEEFDGDLLEQGFSAELNGDIGGCKHVLPVGGRGHPGRRAILAQDPPAVVSHGRGARLTVNREFAPTVAPPVGWPRATKKCDSPGAAPGATSGTNRVTAS